MLSPVFDPVFAWAPGPYELLIIAVIVLVLFGHRLPQTMRSMGRSIKEFQGGMKEGAAALENDEDRDDIRDEERTAKRKDETVRES